jgi:phosphotransferase system HPr (HPr) family protein
MLERTITVKDKTGLHARTASLFARNALQFNSEIKIIFNNKEANGKSILSLLSLGVAYGKEIKIRANGEDEQKTVDSLVQLIENNFETK